MRRVLVPSLMGGVAPSVMVYLELRLASVWLGKNSLEVQSLASEVDPGQSCLLKNALSKVDGLPSARSPIFYKSESRLFLTLALTES